jgi:hypothetical protein
VNVLYSIARLNVGLLVEFVRHNEACLTDWSRTISERGADHHLLAVLMFKAFMLRNLHRLRTTCMCACAADHS